MKSVEQSEVKTGMAYIAAANGLRICYGSQQLLVKSEDDEKVTVSIYRADGQQAGQYSLNVQGGKARVDVANLNQGDLTEIGAYAFNKAAFTAVDLSSASMWPKPQTATATPSVVSS